MDQGGKKSNTGNPRDGSFPDSGSPKAQSARRRRPAFPHTSKGSRCAQAAAWSLRSVMRGNAASGCRKRFPRQSRRCRSSQAIRAVKPRPRRCISFCRDLSSKVNSQRARGYSIPGIRPFRPVSRDKGPRSHRAFYRASIFARRGVWRPRRLPSARGLR